MPLDGLRQQGRFGTEATSIRTSCSWDVDKGTSTVISDYSGIRRGIWMVSAIFARAGNETEIIG
ncbi:MAG: hypothetical protein K0Q73_7490, partial [Paenibacillus sp.]|nr:hypothetical protein [Paenibacillus sp.]